MDTTEARLTADLHAAVHQLYVAKLTFAAITGIYLRRGPDPITAEIRAAGNYDRQCSIADAQWHQQEAQTAALALLALRSVEGWN